MKLLTREMLAKAESIQIPSRRRSKFHERGEKASLRKGASLEFSDYREYLQGDDIRSVDWNVYARTERLYLKLFLEEQSKPVYFLIDASASMKFGNPAKFDFARALSALLAYSCLRRYDRPQILFLRNGPPERFRFPARKEFFRVLKQIEEQTCAEEIGLNRAIRQVALANLPRGIFFVLSDFYSPQPLDSLQLLAAANNEIHCLQILSEQELRPDFRGDLRFLDAETQGKSEVSISAQTLAKYQSALGGFQTRVRTAAHRSGAGYSCINSSRDLGKVVFEDLRRKGIVA